jgi:hypothetical protein
MRALVTKRPPATCIAILALLCARLFSAALFSGVYLGFGLSTLAALLILFGLVFPWRRFA